MRFFLGTHRPYWLPRTTAPLFVSNNTLREYKRKLPVAKGTWALDSGGFSQLKDHGGWDCGPTPREYADRVRRYREEIGGLLWAAPQDWMCEPEMVAKTGLSVTEHQKRTVANFCELREIAPDLPIIPVLQGWVQDDYLACLRMYADAGVDLTAEPTVGIGSVCRREATQEAAAIIAAVCEAAPGIRLHGFGIKTAGLHRYGRLLYSSDSMAWSFNARRKGIRLPGCNHVAKNCAGCEDYAFRWRERVLASLAGHITRRNNTPRKPVCIGGKVSRKLDTTRAATDTDRRLALSGFRNEAGRLERDATIRAANRDGMSVRAIAARMDLSPARVGQILATDPGEPLLDQLRDLRARWGVDDDPASRAAADLIIATLAADDLVAEATAGDLDDGIVGDLVHDRPDGDAEMSLFDMQ